ncbi:integrin alpha-9-like [Carlito syrichta]|uniref:Integrin alpha-9-like n=1 Tax=Carlito syrichta TaxID=1868482 RepID=A0A3Q0DSN5_CARSF|nr:integrin alpha-9-like [Carlito syrichta]
MGWPLGFLSSPPPVILKPTNNLVMHKCDIVVCMRDVLWMEECLRESHEGFCGQKATYSQHQWAEGHVLPAPVSADWPSLSATLADGCILVPPQIRQAQCGKEELSLGDAGLFRCTSPASTQASELLGQRRVQDVISPIVFEAAYSLGEHVTGKEDRELPALTPVLRWKKGQKIAQKNQTVFERNCHSEDCAADLQLRGKLLLSSIDDKTPYLALGAVKNISLNISIANLGDDAYDANVSFNVSRELFFINMWQKEEMGISCELLELDFLKCSVGFPFMRSKSKYEFSVIFDTSHLSGEEEVLSFIVTAQSGNVERTEALHDNSLMLTVPLMHEVDTSITGIISPTSFVYGESVDASNFIQMDDLECHFQPINVTLQVYNTGPSTLPGSSVSISFPNLLSSGGAEMFHVQEMVVGQEKGNCSFQKNPTPCIIPQEQENIFHTIFAFFTKSGRKVLVCEQPGISCLTMHCNLSALAKEESRTIDIYMLLNTEILKKDSSSVIQFVARAKVKVDPALRVVEIAHGNPEETTVVFEALHNLEPRGYVVGWIIAISLLVGILIFLLLAVLLWKMGFFRRRYKEIIEAEKNRKENEDSWDWVQKNQ